MEEGFDLKFLLHFEKDIYLEGSSGCFHGFLLHLEKGIFWMGYQVAFVDLFQLLFFSLHYQFQRAWVIRLLLWICSSFYFHYMHYQFQQIIEWKLVCLNFRWLILVALM